MTWCPAVCQESGQREGEGLAEEGEEVTCRRCDGSACQRGERGRLAWLLPARVQRAPAPGGQGMGAGGCGRTNGELGLEFRNK